MDKDFKINQSAETEKVKFSRIRFSTVETVKFNRYDFPKTIEKLEELFSRELKVKILIEKS